jgi:DNA-binding NtrC family response regulator
MNDAISDDTMKNALVIDDESIVLIFLNRLLTKWNINADCASNAPDALTNIKNKEYDFILMDVRMPDISGLELFNKIKEIKPELAKRVIFVTGDTAGRDTIDFLRETGIFCVPKPVDITKLKSTIETVIESRKNTF